MNGWIWNLRVSAVQGVPLFVDLSAAVSRIIFLSSCNVIFGLIVFLLEKGGDNMKTWVKNLTVVCFSLAIIVALGISNVQAAGFGHGQRFGEDMKLLSSLSFTPAEKEALETALSTYGPAVKTAWQQVRSDRRQLKTDLSATPPVAATIGNDFLKIKADKEALKTARGTLYTALVNSLSPANQTALQTALTTQFQDRLPSKMGRLLSVYARHLSQP